MKDELLKSVSHRIDILESKLFDKEQENDALKKKIEDLETTQTNAQTSINEKMNDLETVNMQLKLENNSLEQYGRRNNIRVVGIPEQENESAEQTAQTVAETLNAKLPNTNLKRYDIDIAHRLGKKRDGKPRTVIMKFVSRMTRDNVFKNRKNLKGSNIFINEDLTRINQNILTCVRVKMTDEVESAWSSNGRIFYKHKDKTMHEVKSKDYEKWVDMPWPEKNEETSENT